MIAKDKQLHIGAGVVIGLSAFIIGVYALPIVWITGIGKEVYDKVSGKGVFDIADMAATCVAGSAVAAIILYT